MNDESERSVLVAPMAATVASVAGVGEVVAAGVAVVVLEVMKMEHPVTATFGAEVVELLVAAGEQVAVGQRLAVLRPAEPISAEPGVASPDASGERADLAELRHRRALLADAARPDAVAKRHARGQRTARENVADLVDEGSFQEYGGFAFAAQEGRRPRAELEARTPADGLITGIGRVNTELVGLERAACAVVAYDYTVLAGTQGQRNHAKKDRIFELVERLRLPVVLFAEGGGGVPATPTCRSSPGSTPAPSSTSPA